MKVQGPGRTQGSSKVTKKGSAAGGDESFGALMASGPSASQGAATTQSIARVDGLLAVQAAEDPTERAAKQRARKRSTDVLDELEKVRMAMLGGSLTVGHMIDIADVVASHREKITDASLTAIMDEIDLRAQVELAKMRVVLDERDAQKSQNSV